MSKSRMGLGLGDEKITENFFRLRIRRRMFFILKASTLFIRFFFFFVLFEVKYYFENGGGQKKRAQINNSIPVTLRLPVYLPTYSCRYFFSFFQKRRTYF